MKHYPISIIARNTPQEPDYDRILWCENATRRYHVLVMGSSVPNHEQLYELQSSSNPSPYLYKNTSHREMETLNRNIKMPCHSILMVLVKEDRVQTLLTGIRTVPCSLHTLGQEGEREALTQMTSMFHSVSTTDTEGL